MLVNRVQSSRGRRCGVKSKRNFSDSLDQQSSVVSGVSTLSSSFIATRGQHTGFNYIHIKTTNLKRLKITKNELYAQDMSISHHTFTILYCVQAVFSCYC